MQYLFHKWCQRRVYAEAQYAFVSVVIRNMCCPENSLHIFARRVRRAVNHSYDSEI